MKTSVILFNRDLRTHDHPALIAAARAERTAPLFVFDERLLRSRFAAPNRLAFMLESLRDLDQGLRRVGGRLFVRRGDPVREALAMARECGAEELHVSADWSAYARAREERLRRACAEERIEFTAHPGITIVPPGEVVPASGDHFRVFSPYHRAWSELPKRQAHGRPRPLAVPSRLRAGRLPRLEALRAGSTSPRRAVGGEDEGRRLMRAFLRDGLGRYEDHRDDLPAGGTSRLSAYIRWGCVSPLELAREAEGRPGGAAFVRQLCWRDFHHQVLAATPSLPRRDYRPRGDRWSRSRRALETWCEGRTGYPLVDAAMRQLAEEGFMHNRGRMTVASFLCKDLYVDWRAGAWHFWDLLCDGEIANNAGNWQWVAGTGNDTRPNRVLNPVRQAERFDPDGRYVRRYLPELESIQGKAIFRPWLAEGFSRSHYPEPIVDHEEAAAAFKARRAG
ncbi:MAG TPA: deoxyribodipyrimidine photo-lyase [Solirubrobacterales bacterium]|jgi:deoxyribodipyrimidine photo-lyase|nr:deoxyribodipyrimidine photo-lyase [Solirubrobacterales bacterium]